MDEDTHTNDTHNNNPLALVQLGVVNKKVIFVGRQIPESILCDENLRGPKNDLAPS